MGEFWEREQIISANFARSETSAAKQSRLSRVQHFREHPQVYEKTKVSLFILWKHGSGMLHWGQVFRHSYEECWSIFTPNQRTYNEYTNTWTLSKLFAPDEFVQDLDDNDGFFNKVPTILLPDLPDDADETFSETNELKDMTNKDLGLIYSQPLKLSTWVCPDSLEDIIRARYAFVFRPNMTEGDDSRDPDEVVSRLIQISKPLGSYSVQTSKPQREEVKEYCQMLDFLSSIVEDKGDHYKLYQDPPVESNDQIIMEKWGMSHNGETLYRIRPENIGNDVSWYLIITDTVTGFEILRRRWGDSLKTIARELVLRGIPFYTLLTRRDIELAHGIEDNNDDDGSGNDDQVAPIIWQNIDEALQQGDQGSYYKRVQEIFSKPRGRKALLMGGVVWRWAMEFLKPEDVLFGPSHECLRGPPVCTRNGIDYYDDFLNDSELRTIVGCYRVPTATGILNLISINTVLIYIMYRA